MIPSYKLNFKISAALRHIKSLQMCSWTTLRYTQKSTLKNLKTTVIFVHPYAACATTERHYLAFLLLRQTAQGRYIYFRVSIVWWWAATLWNEDAPSLLKVDIVYGKFKTWEHLCLLITSVSAFTEGARVTGNLKASRHKRWLHPESVLFSAASTWPVEIAAQRKSITRTSYFTRQSCVWGRNVLF